MPKKNTKLLPVWNLKDLYKSNEDVTADLEKIAILSKNFQAKYKQQLAIDNLLEAIKSYEAISLIIGRVAGYAYLHVSENREDDDRTGFYQYVMDALEEPQRDLLFFSLAINALDETLLKNAYQQNKDLQYYQPFIDNVRVYKKHELSEDLEQAFHDRDATAKEAWIRLYDETMAGLRFQLQGETVTEAEILHALSTSPEASVRKQAAEEFGLVLEENSRLFCLITNTLAKDKTTIDKWRHYKQPVSSRNLANKIDDADVENLVKSVTNAYPRLTHRYYGLKAKWFGQKQLDYWDRNAPLVGSAYTDIPWEKAVEIVLEAFGDFSPLIAETGEQFFTKSWIHARPQPGKDSGAYSHPLSTDTHPYILMNYQGGARDVLTLAHELGHGVHQWLAREQGELLSDTPLTVAETASVFGEMLTFRSLLKTADAQTAKTLLAGKVEDMLNTVVRQIAFHQFETKVHNQRRQGELSKQQLSEIWMQTQQNSLGQSIKLHDSYKMYWSYIPHFIHTPFYVYAYAFGDCLVNNLYQQYQQQPAGFEDKYIDLLKAGGSQHWQTLLAPFGLNPKAEDFWDGGLKVIEGLIDELEALS